ncbi:MAG: DEAD/DEAH box helicase [Candidatus Liberibacter ctenarytainae]|uniref:DEAD/DEAH box helicase n=1 Tax=Candidatus Liberibacter ctenarytainae TaxID=2020335 RepID=A0A937AF54_9HYPH|nr:DEAD/DEAH box helicase [Candidatus Liberibacter ctenarytainae]
MITAYHAKYYAHDLTKIGASTHADRLSTSLFDASVDLNPHQVEAALFAIRSPLSKGVILADEVGLGKTIEAGIVLCQFWAEHKCRLLVICPASLRRQWSIELEEKFNLPNIILESACFKSRKKNEGSPLKQESIVIISYQFASRYNEELRKINWDLVIIDEAHKLRNLYKPDNKMGKNIQSALSKYRKVLLTATPLQNSLMELYGLASLIDDRIFGSAKSFKAAYVNSTPNAEKLKDRLKPFLQRTLRNQVLEYIRYTKREAIIQPFTPTEEEQRLYDAVSDFLLEQDTYAIPWAQRKLVVLIIRKLMASSSYALIGTLKMIKQRLENMKQIGKAKPLDIRTVMVSGNDLSSEYLEEEEEPPEVIKTAKGKPVDLKKLQYEIKQIEGFTTIARSIKVESKAKELVKALDIGFARMKKLGAECKALIFTESSRTQRYLKEFLTDRGYKGKIVTFNGQNNDDLARSIYRSWLDKNTKTGRVTGTLNVDDMRMSLIDFFRDEGKVMIATEAAAEGLNLQFCSLLVNYDLPWNPQRVEQRIGRVHRYGQKHDVVVVNFLNQTNWADQRIYALLKEKFHLFDGVFGASDEILGRIESGIDFEKRIFDLWETCRNPEEIEAAFQQLQEELDEPIQEHMSQTRKKLFDHFDADVHQRLRDRMQSAEKRIDEVTRMFWGLVKFVYTVKHSNENSRFYFNDEKLVFGIDEAFIKAGARSANDNERVPIYYYIDTSPPEKLDPLALAVRRKRKSDDLKHPVTGYPCRLSSLEGEMAIKSAKEMETNPAHLDFNISQHPHRIALLEEYVGKSGWLFLNRLTLDIFEKTDQLFFAICDSEGTMLKEEVGEKLFLLPATFKKGFNACPYQEYIDATLRARTNELIKQAELNNHSYFNEELDKLYSWAEDLKKDLDIEINRLDKEIQGLDWQSRQVLALQEKLAFQKEKAALEKDRSNKRHELFSSQDEIDKKRDRLIQQIEKQLQNSKSSVEELFKISWTLY